METNTDVVVLAEPLGLDERRGIFAKVRLQEGRKKFLLEFFLWAADWIAIVDYAIALHNELAGVAAEPEPAVSS